MAVNTLSRELRNRLQVAVAQGRDIAEAAAAEVLRYYGVADARRPSI